MKNMAFKVGTKKEESLASFIKEVNEIPCQFQIDLENGLIIIENAEDTMTEFVIESINQYYTILGVDINNISDEPGPTLEVEGRENTGPESKPTVVGPQSENDLIIQKVEFKNEYVEYLINKFMQTAYWAMYRHNAAGKDIGDFILTSMSEISMRYNSKRCIEYSVGDIVDCNYGMHLPGETSGGHIHAIVCKVRSDNMAYLVPIAKGKENLTSVSYLIFNVPEDVIYYKKHYTSGVALFDMGRYLRTVRFNKVIGRTTPEFFAKVLKQLSTTFDFTDNAANTEANLGNNVVDVDTTAMLEERATPKTEAKDTKLGSESADNSEVTISELKPKKAKRKISTEEEALLPIIGDSLEKLKSIKTHKKKIETFLADIGMTTTEQMVTQSFVVACSLYYTKKINYNNVIIELHRRFPEVKKNRIKLILRENFKIWLEMHPELEENYHCISLMSILRVYAKRFA